MFRVCILPVCVLPENHLIPGSTSLAHGVECAGYFFDSIVMVPGLREWSGLLSWWCSFYIVIMLHFN